MKISPFQLYLKSLAYGPVRLGFLEKDVAYDRLKRITGQDFGYDIAKWKAWGQVHPEVADGLYLQQAKSKNGETVSGEVKIGGKEKDSGETDV